MEVGRDAFALLMGARLPAQRRSHFFHAVFHLDQVLPASPISGLELQVTRDDPLRSGLDRGEPIDDRAGILLSDWEGAHRLKENRFAIGSPDALQRVPDLVERVVGARAVELRTDDAE